MKKFIQILSILLISNIFYAQKQENPVLKELNELILNTKLYGGFYNGMTREDATNEYETKRKTQSLKIKHELTHVSRRQARTARTRCPRYRSCSCSSRS